MDDQVVDHDSLGTYYEYDVSTSLYVLLSRGGLKAFCFEARARSVDTAQTTSRSFESPLANS
jgi:hypothetical protein